MLAVVAGAATPGIGQAVTRRLLGDGYAVCGSYGPGDRAAARELAGTPGLTLSETDHASPASLAVWLDSLPAGIPVNAAVCAQRHFALETPDRFDAGLWKRIIAVNLTGPAAVYHALRYRFAPAAAFVTVTSAEALTGTYGAAAYVAAKAGMHNLTKTLANQSGRTGPRVNAVAAGWIAGLMDTDDVLAEAGAATPLGRLGRPEEIAAAVAFLLSPESSYVHGTVLVADGGYSGADPAARHELEVSAGGLG